MRAGRTNWNGSGGWSSKQTVDKVVPAMLKVHHFNEGILIVLTERMRMYTPVVVSLACPTFQPMVTDVFLI